jgi:hypothetical protein
MTAQLKSFPKSSELKERLAADDRYERLRELARKASLLSFALTGVMSLTGNDETWGLRDAADEIHGELMALAKEVAA